MKIKKGDTIKVLMGRDNGKTGKVEVVNPDKNTVLVPGINEYKRHVKARSQNEKSEIITITKPMVSSKVAIVCPKCHKATRIGLKIEKGAKVRICRKCLKPID
ncbi:MAG TPA: 50S ribosomal protein L24 [Patescibacteria group bacterium]|nr:50S ribosomal protein L24 [Patescibacteria group bacterium]